MLHLAAIVLRDIIRQVPVKQHAMHVLRVQHSRMQGKQAAVHALTDIMHRIQAGQIVLHAQIKQQGVQTVIKQQVPAQHVIMQVATYRVQVVLCAKQVIIVLIIAAADMLVLPVQHKEAQVNQAAAHV